MGLLRAVVITNVVVNGLLLLRVVYALIVKLYEEAHVPSVKRKLVHVLLACFGLCTFSLEKCICNTSSNGKKLFSNWYLKHTVRFGWSVQELFGGNPKPLHFFLDTTAICLFFTAFIIVFFHLYVNIYFVRKMPIHLKLVILIKIKKTEWMEHV